VLFGSGEEFARAGGPDEVENHGAAVGLDGDAEAQEAAALTFGIHGAWDLRQRVGIRRETEAQSAPRALVPSSPANESRQQAFPARAQRLGRQRTGDRYV